MPRLLLLGSAANATTVDLAGAWRARGVDAVVVDGPGALASCAPGDVVLGRLDVRPTLDGVEPGLLALLLLERRGAVVLNDARALLAAHDKLRTTRVLAGAGLPHPLTEGVRPGERPALRPPLVLKPRFGSWGVDVQLCPTSASVDRVLADFGSRPWYRRHGVLAQELLPPLGHDVRVVVAGGRIVGAVQRRAAPGEWRTNISLGGARVPTEVDDVAAELARAAAAAAGADFVGVDLAPLPDGDYVVLELNGAAEFDATYSLGGRDVYEEALRALAAHVNGLDTAVAGGASGET